ncbi:MAG: histidine phosphatase family protein [Verrucomicrobia subdivision 3 bacterium]|nr:histidine phosphatase family protein [Limisphaerales bacterium]
MSQLLPEIHVIRHGETAWTESRQHTGLTDIPLTPRGERQARHFGQYLRGRIYPNIFTSPLQRAKRTCELAGFSNAARVEPDLVEWNYGDYEGLTRDEVVQRSPGWRIFRDGCPNGESVAEVGARADRVIGRLRALDGDVLLFSSGHFMRVFAARWLGLDASCGRLFLLSTTTLSVLGYDHDKNEPVIRLWNDVRPGGIESSELRVERLSTLNPQLSTDLND